MTTLKDLYQKDDGERQSILRRVRLCASLTKPHLLPPQGQTPNEKLPEVFTSIGARGLTNMEGRILLALYPPGIPWFQLTIAPQILYDQSIPDAAKQSALQHLFMQELLIQSVLESAALATRNVRRRASFRSRKRMVLSQIIGTGDALEKVEDDYRIRLYRRDMYVTRRDSAGDVLYHCTIEKTDAASLDDDAQAKADLSNDTRTNEDPTKRMVDLYTRCSWQPVSRAWLIEQEINGKIVVESEEPVSPFISTPFELAPEEHYGRGFVELNLGTLRTVNELEEKMLDFAALASKMLTAIDNGSNVRDEDLTKPSGSIIRAHVAGGQVQDVGMVGMNQKINDFGVVFQTMQFKHKDLSAAMLLESAIQPTGERVTATQIQRIAMELEGTLGGLYAPIADEQQIPLLQRVIYQLQRDKLMPALPDEAIEIKALTGIAALSRDVASANLMTVMQAVGALGPTAMKKIDTAVLVDVLMRYRNVYEPGLIKSNEQVQAEIAQELQQQLALTAGNKAIDVVGNAAEQEIAQTGV